MNKRSNQVDRVLVAQAQELKNIKFPKDKVEAAIAESESLLESLGYGDDVKAASESAKLNNKQWKPDNNLVVPQWEELVKKAELSTNEDSCIDELFTEQELKDNYQYVCKLNSDYNSIHRLDSIDIAICASAGLISGAIDVLLVGFPQSTVSGTKAGPLSNYIRELFEKKFPPEEMEKLGRLKEFKTPYDAQDNRNTAIRVEGLSSYYHRLLSLGHDPILGFLFGVLDILKGSMTTIDKNGKIVVQVIEEYSDRKEYDLFSALSKHLRHLKSDITTPQGLPAPFMGLFNMCQFGSIGEYEQTVAEIVQGMYYEGYDFIQFCSSSIPVILTEVVVRMGWAIKRHSEGHVLKECIPVNLNREKNPKLATMLFIANSAATAINAGKVYFTKNPTAINMAQWYAFARYSFNQLKWNLYQKGNLRDKYVANVIDDELSDILASIEKDYTLYNSLFESSLDNIIM